MSTPGHRLIAIATSAYAGIPDDDVAPLVGVREHVVELFTKTLGCYAVVLPQIAANPTAQAMRDALDDWFGSDDRVASDWVVFYYTGHAELVAPDSLYLLTTEYVADRPVRSAFDTRQLLNVVLSRRTAGAPRRTQNVLFIFDACYTGQTVPNFTASLAEAFRVFTRGMFYVVGTALQEAQAGAFSAALIAEIDDLSRRYAAQEYLFIDQILAGVNRRLRVHEAILCTASVPYEIPKFFPNPGYVGSGPFLADEAQRALGDREFREHWILRSRGVGLESHVGGYFSGRRAVLERLEAFLRNRLDTRIRVLTGSAGGGKSAILGRIVALASIHDLPPIDLAVYARGKTVDDILAQTAAQFAVEPTLEALLRYARTVSGTFRVLVDALDEAVEPRELARQLLVPLGALPAVRLIVATRREYVRRFANAEVIDIDEPAYAHESDIADYVLARLLRRREDRAVTPFSDTASTAALARRVAARAYPNFLVARLTAEVLLRGATDDVAARGDLPAAIPEAFDWYLRDFGDDEERARDLLLPLAFAQAPGLPWDSLWPSIATRIAGRAYTDADVRWLLANAGAFILESAYEGRSVYRLYHESLAEHLRSGRELAPVARAFVDALVASVPLRTDADGPDWALATPYVLENLVVHCQHSGSLAQIVDPYFLLCARPRRLLRLLLERHDLPATLADPYADISRHRGASLPEIAAYFEMSARMRAYKDSADDVARLPLSRSWRAVWARWSGGAARPLLFTGAEPISCLAASDWFDERPYVALARGDGSLEVWDAEEFECVFAETAVSPGQRVVAVHLARTADGGWLAAAWADGTVAAFDVSAGTLVGRRIGAAVARSIAVVDRGDTGLCVVGDRDGGLTLLRLPDLATVAEKKNALYSAVTTMTTVTAEGERVLVTASDGRGSDGRSRPALNAWSLRDLARLWHSPRSYDYVETLMALTFAGRELLLASGSPMEETQVWDVAARRVIARRPFGQKHSWLHVNGPKLLLVARLQGRTLVEEVALDSAGDGRILKAANSVVKLEGETFAGPVRLRGRPFLAVAAGSGVRLWDLSRLAQTTVFNWYGGKKPYATASFAPLGSTLFVAGSAIRAASTADGKELGVWPTDALVRGRDAAEPAVVTVSVAAVVQRVFGCSNTGHLFEVDRANVGEIRRINSGDYRFSDFCAVAIGGRILGFAATSADAGYRQRWFVTIWDLDAGREIETGAVLGHRFGAEDKAISALTAMSAGGAVRFALASSYGKVLVATFDVASQRVSTTLGAIDEWSIPREDGYTTSLASAACGGRNLLAGGSDSGRITVWDFDAGTIVRTRAAAHKSAVSALRFGRLADRDVLVSGGWDGILAFADLDLQPMLRVEVGVAIACIDFLDNGMVAVGTSEGVLALAIDAALLEFADIDPLRDADADAKGG